MKIRSASATQNRWYVLSILTLIYAFNIADRFVVSTVLEPIRRDLGLSDAGVAFLTGVALALFYVTVGLPIATLADRSNRRNIVAASVAIWSAMTTLCGFATNFWQLLLGRFGVGFGEAGGTPPSTSMLADSFAPRDRPLALTLFALGAPVGSWIGAQLAGSLADAFTWRGAFMGLGAPGLVIAAITYLTIAEPVRGRFDGKVQAAATRSATLRDTLRWLWHDKAALHAILGGTVATLWGWGLMWWTPTFLMRAYELTAGEAGAILGPIHLVAGTAATLVTGYLVSRPFARDNARISLLLAVVILASTIPSVLIYGTSSRASAVALLWSVIPAVYLFIGPTMGILQNLVPSTMRAQAIAVLMFTANVANLVIAPQLVGLASDHLAVRLGNNTESLRWALVGLAFTGLWACFHYARSAQALGIREGQSAEAQ